MTINISKLTNAIKIYHKLSMANRNWANVADKYIDKLTPIYKYYRGIGSIKMPGHSNPGKYIMEALERMKKNESISDILGHAINDVNNFIAARLKGEDKRFRHLDSLKQISSQGEGLSYDEAEHLQELLKQYEKEIGFLPPEYQ